jgi:hypothetical protein
MDAGCFRSFRQELMDFHRRDFVPPITIPDFGDFVEDSLLIE